MTLREMRQARSISLTHVQAATGINRGTLSKIERGIELPTGAQLVLLSQTYGVDPAGWHPRILFVYTGEGSHGEAIA